MVLLVALFALLVKMFKWLLLALSAFAGVILPYFSVMSFVKNGVTRQDIIYLSVYIFLFIVFILVGLFYYKVDDNLYFLESFLKFMKVSVVICYLLLLLISYLANETTIFNTLILKTGSSFDSKFNDFAMVVLYIVAESFWPCVIASIIYKIKIFIKDRQI